MAAEFIGYKPQARRGYQESTGWVEEDVAIVRGAASISEAILAAGMPAFGSAHPTNPDIEVRRFEPEEITHDGSFYIRIVWAEASVTSPARTFQGAEWTHSLVSQRLLLDLDGEPIGRRHYRDPVGPNDWSKLIHDGAEIGVDVQIPYSQVEIIKPLPATYSPAVVHSRIGKTNDANMAIDGVTFAAGEVILIGARASRLQPLPFNQYDVRYLLAVGRSVLPGGGLPAKLASDLSLYTDTTIPLKFGYSVIFTAHKADGGLATDQNQIAESRPYYVLIHRLFEAADMSALGIS